MHAKLKARVELDGFRSTKEKKSRAVETPGRKAQNAIDKLFIP